MAGQQIVVAPKGKLLFSFEDFQIQAQDNKVQVSYMYSDHRPSGINCSFK